MKNLLYKLTLKLYLFSIAFYFIFSTISPKFFLNKNFDYFSGIHPYNSLSYYSALTSNEVKAVTKKMFLDMKYRIAFSIQKESIPSQLIITKDGKIIGNLNTFELTQSFKYWNTLSMKKQIIHFDIFKITFFNTSLS